MIDRFRSWFKNELMSSGATFCRSVQLLGVLFTAGVGVVPSHRDEAVCVEVAHSAHAQSGHNEVNGQLTHVADGYCRLRGQQTKARKCLLLLQASQWEKALLSSVLHHLSIQSFQSIWIQIQFKNTCSRRNIECCCNSYHPSINQELLWIVM